MLSGSENVTIRDLFDVTWSWILVGASGTSRAVLRVHMESIQSLKPIIAYCNRLA